MPETIYKYPLEVTDTQTIQMPKNAWILCVQVQSGTPCLWAVVKPEMATEPRIFHSVGTGHPMPENTLCEHIDTYQLRGGALVFHVFEEIG